MWEVSAQRRDRTCCPAPGGAPERYLGRRQHREEPQGGTSGGGRGLSWLCQAPRPLSLLLAPASLTLCSSSGDRDAECPQESAPCTLAPGPWRGPAPLPELSSPESESRGPGPRSSPRSSPEGSPRPWGRHTCGISPTCTPDTSRLSLLETDGADPSSLEREEASEAPEPREDVKNEGVGYPDMHRASTEG